MISHNKIKIILVTGFLGSGKTTFLNRLIDFYNSKKIALIINDFGKIAIDGVLLRNKINGKFNSKIYEISNGSIFCSCLNTELVKSLNYFIDVNPEILIVETSGLSDPSTFRKILSENNLDNFYNIENSLCIIDSTNVLKLYKKISTIEKQIISSNIILVNKCDLIDDDEYHKIEKQIKFINGNSLILRTEYSHFHFSLLSNKQTISLNGSVSCNTLGNKLGSILLEQKELEKENIKEFYRSITKYIFRLKGFIIIRNSIYYISDNVGELQFEEFNRKVIPQYGLSILLNKENITMVRKAWNLL